MAEGLVGHLYGDRFEAESAGAMPSEVNPNTTEVMDEMGIDIFWQRSKSVMEFVGQRFDYVVTLCGDNPKEVYPSFMGEARERLHWGFPDPVEAQGTREEILEVFREVRDGIRKKIEDLANGVVWHE